MKLTFAAALLALPLALAESLKSVVITFPKGTPDSVIIQAKESLVASGGVITHEYHLIKYGINECFSFMKSHSNYGFSGFAAEAPASALQTLSAQDAKYNPNIEEDKVVSAYGDYAAAL
ncbi:Proteinase inhibitorpropeptide [Penicillium sp. IBT 31633x]|nr:Proteinase inhibitorpropeptide [Penicillium sp. IBT 31633x]